MAATETLLEVIDKDGDLILAVGIDEDPDEMTDREGRAPQELVAMEEDLWGEPGPSYGRTGHPNGDEISISDYDESDLTGQPRLQDLRSQEEELGRETSSSSRHYVRLLVSSTFLTHASPVFKVMLDGRFAEGQLTLSKQNPPTIALPEDDPDTVALLCKILHLIGDIYQRVTGKQLIKLAVISDKYNCSRSLVPWFRGQLHQFTIPATGIFDQVALDRREMSLEQVILISYLIDDNEMFAKSTETYYREKSREQIQISLKLVVDGWIQSDLVATIQNWQDYFLDRAAQIGGDVLESVVKQMNMADHEGSSYDKSSSSFALCPGHAQRLGALSAVLTLRGLWPNSNRCNKSVSGMMREWEDVGAINFHDDRTPMPVRGGTWGPCMCADRLNINTELELRIIRLEFDLRGGICLPCFKRKGRVETPAECPNMITHKLWPHCVLNAENGLGKNGSG
ncbi:uncharacterized protein PV06_02161 [Exophiala oligosperma]|uniref:BTB domain-containing protein n=1 Tax=Exophiala oligosperma TaxID=215243 RepID=A0A0D2C9L9_9EURO|nr:uncharacterized protein PV06_02161 [Exophiala oligosperma]KIW46492.1 hypothetical protein PV06_02161 [Exophiala oligosperma]